MEVRLSVSMSYWPVSPPLRGLIDDIYVFRSSGPSYHGLAGALLPQAQWRLSGEFGWQARGGALQPMPENGAFGPSTAALHLSTAGETVVVGFGFYPEGWSAFMPLPAGSVTERVIPLKPRWGVESNRLLAQCHPNDDDGALAAVVDAYMLKRLADAAPIDPRIAVISEWANSAEHDLQVLTDRLQVSYRHAQRLTTAAHGLAPRHLANKHKILRIAAALALSDRGYGPDTWALQFADQSHFINNFRRYVGTTPTQFLRQAELLVRDVMRARFDIASRHPLGLGSSPPIGQ